MISYLNRAAGVVAKNYKLSTDHFAERLQNAMKNATFRGVIKNMNVFEMANSSDKAIENQFKAMKQLEEKNVAKERTHRVEEVAQLGRRL